jgi:hypothetical protein
MIPTGVNAILFVRATLSKEDLNELVHCILSDIAKTKQNKVRYCHPVSYCVNLE